MVEEKERETQVAQPVDMARGKVSHVLGRLAIPLMTSLFFQNLYAYADTVFVSWLGEMPLAAVSLALPLTYLALSLSKGVAMGSVILMSFARGSGNEAGASRISAALLPLMTLTMALFLPLMLPEVCDSFYKWLGADSEISAQGRGFTFWLVAGFPVMGYVMAAEALFTSRGDTVTPMKAMLLGNALNIALDPLYIFVFGWGAAGAAIATLTGQSVAALYMRNRLAASANEKLCWWPGTGFASQWQKILGQGLFVSMAYLISPLALVMLNKILAQFGPVAVGAWNMMSRTEMMVMLPIMGMSNALAAFVSFNLGRLEYVRVREGLSFFLKISWGISAPVMLIFFLFPQEMTLLFRPGDEMRTLGGIAMQASAISGLFTPLLYAVAGMSQGLKRPTYMMGQAFVYLICLRVPLANEFAARWGEQGVFWSHPTASACTALVAIFLLRHLMLECRRRVDAAKLDSLANESRGG